MTVELASRFCNMYRTDSGRYVCGEYFRTGNYYYVRFVSDIARSRAIRIPFDDYVEAYETHTGKVVVR